MKRQLKLFCSSVKLLFKPKIDSGEILIETTDSKLVNFFAALNKGLDAESLAICYEWYFNDSTRNNYTEQYFSDKRNMSLSCYQKRKKDIEKLMIFTLKVTGIFSYLL